jgi:hypothetical protein
MMLKKNLRFFLLIFFMVFFLLFATGCDVLDFSEKPVVVVSQDSIYSRVESQLRETGNVIKSRYLDVTAMELASFPAPPAIRAPSDPSLLQPIDIIDWYGPPEDLLQFIAKKIGYQYRYVGNPVPHRHIMVLIDARQKPAYQVLHDIGIQLGTHVILRSSAKRRELLLEFTPPEYKMPTISK